MVTQKECTPKIYSTCVWLWNRICTNAVDSKIPFFCIKDKQTNKQINKQKISIEIPKVYLFSSSGRLFSSVRCDKETRDEHQTKKLAHWVNMKIFPEKFIWSCFFIILNGKNYISVHSRVSTITMIKIKVKKNQSILAFVIGQNAKWTPNKKARTLRKSGNWFIFLKCICI